MIFYSRKKRPPAIVIVSLIDILAILLIFFIVTTTFKKDQPQVKINLPESTTAEEIPAEREPLLISVTREGGIVAGERRIDLPDLAGFIADAVATDAARPFALQADEEAPFGTVIGVMDAFKENGIRNIPAFTREGKAGGGG